MGPELLKIQPQELKFTFELKKQSTCSVQLVNNSDEFVAFKVKTTSPKRYCVRPNVGIVQPRSSCDFTVTMQGPRVAPSDMQCKDKFLIQSTIVPYGTFEEHISPSMFAKDNGKYIEENKLRVVLVSPPNSPVLAPINGALKQEPAYEAPSPKDQVWNSVENLLPHMQIPDNMEELKPTKNLQELKPTKNLQELKPIKDVQELKPIKDVQELKPTMYRQDVKSAKDVMELKLATDVLDLKPAKNMLETELAKDEEELRQAKDEEELRQAKDFEKVKLAKDVEELRPTKDVGELRLAKDEKLRAVKDMEDLEPAKDLHESNLAKDAELRLAKAVELQLAKDIENLKLKLSRLELKQSEAETTITRLEKERNTSFEDRQTLKQEVAMLKAKTVVQNVQVGFPFLFVCMVAIVSIYLGYKLNS